ncbi:hypothetical protein [Paenibacillus sp. TC-CSREp1]|uniref:hypothetical protein n=1 Tax=Paenibacillus sp. TC-CSREp1 TaxID=3410089 RepID=UPI003CE68C4D
MSQVVNQFNFTVIDYTTTQFGYLFTVGTTGSRPQDYRFIYMPYSRYPSVLMLDFYMARSISHGYNQHLVEAVRKDLEGEERFIVLGESHSDKAEIVNHSLEGSNSAIKQGTVMDFSLDMERSALIKALEMDNPSQGDRFNERKDSIVHDEMTEGWRVDNDKELRIFRKLGLTRNFVNNLDKLEPSKISFKVSEFGMIADYAIGAEHDIQSELIIEQWIDAVRQAYPDMEVTEVYHTVNKIIGRQTENPYLLEAIQNQFRDTELVQSVQSQKISQQEVKLIYENLLGFREQEKDTYTHSNIINAKRVNSDKEIVIPPDVSIAVNRRFQEIKYLHIDSTLPSAHREYEAAQVELLQTLGSSIREKTFHATTSPHVSQAMREINENIFFSHLNQAKRSIEQGAVLHENVLAKLKDRQYPTVLHADFRGKREVMTNTYLSHNLRKSSRDYGRNGSVFYASETSWHQANRITDNHPTLTQSGIIDTSREISVITEVERHFFGSVRSQTADMVNVNGLTTAQRIFMEQLHVNDEPLEAKRIFVVHSLIDDQVEQAYREHIEYGFVFRNLHESKRVYKREADVRRDAEIGNRLVSKALELLRDSAKGERKSEFDTYVNEKFYIGQTGGRELYLPESEEKAERKKSFESQLLEVTEAERKSLQELWLPEAVAVTGNKEQTRHTLIQILNSYNKNNQQKNMFLTDQPVKFSRTTMKMNRESVLQSIRGQARTAIIRDELLDKFIGGGWLGNKTYPGYLDEELIVGEIMNNTPAVLLEMLLEAVHDPHHALYVNEQYLADIQQRIDALIECGFLIANKSDHQSELLSFNLEGMKNTYQSHIDTVTSEASQKMSDSSHESSSAYAEVEKYRATKETDHFEGTKVKENLDGEITEVTYGADYNTRPITIETDDPLGYLIPGVGQFPDDPAYETGHVQRKGLPEPELIAGQRFDHNGERLSEEIAGNVRSRNSDRMIELNMGKVDRDRSGIVLEAHNPGRLELRQMMLHEDSLTGESNLSEAYLQNTDWLGSNQDRETVIYREYATGAANIRQLYLNDVYTAGTLQHEQGIMILEQPLGTEIWRSSVLDYDYSIGNSISREGISDVEYFLSFNESKDALFDITFETGERQVLQSDMGISLFETVKHSEVGLLQDEFSAGALFLQHANMMEMLVALPSSYDGEMNSQFIAKNMELSSDLSEELLFIKVSKEAWIHEMETEVVKLRLGQMHEEYGLADHEIRETHFVEPIENAMKNNKEVELEESLLTGSKETRTAFNEETTESDKEKTVQLEEQLLADKPQYGNLDLILPLGGTNLKYGDIPVESIGGTGLHYGDIPIELVGGTNLKYGKTQEVLFSEKPQEGKVEEIWFADKPQYGYWEENLAGLKNNKGSVITEILDLSKELKSMDLMDKLYASKSVRSAHTHEMTSGSMKLLEGESINIILDSYKESKGSRVSTDLVGFQYKQFDVIHIVTGDNEKREAHLDRNLVTGSRMSYYADNHQLHEGVAAPRKVTLELEQIIAGKMDRYAYSHKLFNGEGVERRSQGYDGLFAMRSERLSDSSDEVTSYADNAPYQSYIVKDGETFGSKLSDSGRLHEMTSEAITEERVSSIEQETRFGLANARLSEIEEPESLVASFEERCAQIITGFIFAERPEKRSEYLQELYAFLPERTAHLMEYYHLAKTEPNDSFKVTEHLFAHQESEDAYLPIMDTMAQGLMFDYSDDLLERGMNPEDWEGGMGVPEEYDPHDPFNVYYPYSRDMDALELSQTDEWKSFGKGIWDRDELLGKFYSKNETAEMSGWYRNNFLADTYKFSVNFKVDSDADDKGAGILFKYLDDQNYWMFMIHGGDRENNLDMRSPMQLYQVVAGNVRPVGSPMQPFKWEKGKWYMLSVSVMENRLQIYTDSKLQYDLTGTD